ncbi:50S ribosomal protein L25/general stress protein Ctc [Cytobacillus solani]|uniref:Large ribosomal subunit protein bL25 n=1 Tax=Cytobacillus solani TaxID=1637975 RepID=A0A0Q3T5D9_9BACI|nr:50S ribosomal protein L25/general stress protein Ctc [Cytobacillus solani]KOP70374.1 50S ribosomal protein L25 [Bacillus sp. FJAT-21945]KQL27396.1 50S ribosomal protein L25 [Cytobacillus solani]USK55111.1 50S ribosomal protein L25/general stress protein Ctc [Cytobacillus solani]
MTAVLQAQERKEFRGSALTRIRQDGNIPAVVYGAKLDSKSIYVSEADFTKIIRKVGRNGVISLELGGNKHNVVLSDYQADPIKHEVIHVDFLAVDMSKEITANVRINLVGDAPGVKDGGVLQQSMHELTVTATPDNIPQSVDIDVSNLQVNETLTIADIQTNSGYTINEGDEEVVASILPPRQEAEINSGEEQEPGTPDNEEGRETKSSEE